MPLEPEVRAQIVRMYRDGKKTAEITKATGAARSTIYFVLNEEGVTPKRVGRKSGIPRGTELGTEQHDTLLDWSLGETMRLRARVAELEEKLRTIRNVIDT